MESKLDGLQLTHITYLSLDIGIRNFAYCIVSVDHPQTVNVHQWEKIDLLKENNVDSKISAKFVPLSTLYKITYETLSKRLYHWNKLGIDVVLVEQQLGKSRNAKLEGMVIMWLYSHLKKTVQSVSPNWKLLLDYRDRLFCLRPNKSASSYDQRKEYTVHLVRRWIWSQPSAVRTFFNRFQAPTKKDTKQDDLADALTQAIAYHLKKSSVSKKKQKKK